MKLSSTYFHDLISERQTFVSVFLSYLWSESESLGEAERRMLLLFLERKYHQYHFHLHYVLQ